MEERWQEKDEERWKSILKKDGRYMKERWQEDIGERWKKN